VAPPGIAAADIVASTRLVANGPARSLSVLALNKAGVILFDGAPGDWMSVQLANFAINPAGAKLSYAIYKPDNTELASGVVSAASQTIHVPALPAAGTYTLLLKSGATQTSVDARLETNRSVANDGTTLGVTNRRGQSTRVLFAGVAGEQKALSIAGMVTDPASVSISYQVSLPGGATLRNGTFFPPGEALLLPLTATGVYTLVLAPTSAVNSVSYQLALLPGVALPVDGAAQAVGNTVPGAASRLNFAAIAGDNLGLGITGPASNPTPSMNVTASIYRPDGTAFASTNCYTGGTQCAANLANLPITGSYFVIVRPVADATGTLRVWLSRDISAVMSVGTPVAVAVDRPGRNARNQLCGNRRPDAALRVVGRRDRRRDQPRICVRLCARRIDAQHSVVCKWCDRRNRSATVARNRHVHDFRRSPGCRDDERHPDAFQPLSAGHAIPRRDNDAWHRSAVRYSRRCSSRLRLAAYGLRRSIRDACRPVATPSAGIRFRYP
jgi:hypothetical protein